jgi:hypothetical protein
MLEATRPLRRCDLGSWHITGSEKKGATMADNNEQAASEKSQLETLAHIPLTEEQTAQIKQDIGIEVAFLLVQRVGRTLARELDPGIISVTRLTWCW